LHVATPSHWLMRKVEQSMLAATVVEARVVPNGVDLSLFQPADRLRVRMGLGIPREACVLVFIADRPRTNRWKDFQTLRKAVGLVSERIHERPLLMLAVGDEAPPEWVGQAVLRHVPYDAERANVARYYHAADVYVHAAHVDTFPLTVLEAMACGTPIVATAVGGIPEQVEDGETGFLVPPGDAPGLASRVEALLVDDELRLRVGRQAARNAKHRFDVRQQLDTYLNWYAELVEREGRARSA
jgi:glycosyltransferase involved in cell wall biosynthesis